MDCIFCKIINEEVPSYTVYEDDMFKAFFDIAPANLGHCLVVPKNHCTDIFDLPEKYTKALFVVVQKIAIATKQATNCCGINILQNNGECAGQTVFHFHTHIVPRYKNDKQHITYKPTSPSKEDILKTQQAIKNALN